MPSSFILHQINSNATAPNICRHTTPFKGFEPFTHKTPVHPNPLMIDELIAATNSGREKTTRTWRRSSNRSVLPAIDHHHLAHVAGERATVPGERKCRGWRGRETGEDRVFEEAS
jgi:hypothetical protein